MISTIRRLRSARSFDYLEDGMGTSHVADFLRDPRFAEAYQCGVETASWHGCDLRWRVYNACWAARQASRLEGDFVECGVNRGGISRAVMEFISFASLPRRFFLLDTYKGTPDVAQVNQADYEDCYDDVLRTFAPFPNAVVIRGTVPDTLPQVTSDRICYLSIDMNNSVPELAALRFFWGKLVPGACVILDDYAYAEDYRASKDGIDQLGLELGFDVLTMPTGQGFIVKT
jgi:hypothetical protein